MIDVGDRVNFFEGGLGPYAAVVTRVVEVDRSNVIDEVKKLDLVVFYGGVNGRTVYLSAVERRRKGETWLNGWDYRRHT